MLTADTSSYHAYAFATVRQSGSAFEVARDFVEWVGEPDSTAARVAAEAFGRQAADAKVLLMKLARRKPFDPGPAIERLSEAWETAMNELGEVAFGSRA